MFNVYSPTLQHLGQAEKVSGAEWLIYWQDIGGITLTVADTDDNIALLRNDNYIIVEDGTPQDDMSRPIYLIVDTEIHRDSHLLVVHGKSAAALLHRRSALPTDFPEIGVLDGIRWYISENLRGLPFIVVPYPGDNRSTLLPATSLDGGYLDEITMQLLQYSDHGYHLYLSGSTFVFAVDPGRDQRSAPQIPIFGEESGTAKNSVLIDDASMLCNLAYGRVFLNGEGDKYTMQVLTVGTGGGSDAERREIFAGDFYQADGETAETCVQRVTAEMQATLEEYNRRVSFTAEIPADEYGTLYRLGDLVQVNICGYQWDRRVTGIKWTYDRKGLKSSLILGSRVLTVLKESTIKERHIAATSGKGTTDAKKRTFDLKRKVMAMDIELGGVSAGLDAVVSVDEIDALKKAKATMFAYIIDNGAIRAARLNLSAVQDKDGNIKTLAEILADQISLQGQVQILGNLSISEGRLKVERSIYTPSSVFANKLFLDGSELQINGSNKLTVTTDVGISSDIFTFGRKSFSPVEITSTDGKSHSALGF